MNMIAVDDERLALRALEEVVHEIYPDGALSSFTAPTRALEYAQTHQVDVAFLDVEMGGMTGLELAEKLTDIYDKTNIIFITGYSKYALPAFAVSPSGYLIKPVSPEALEKEMSRLRYPIAETRKSVRIQTFGNFEVFVDGKPLPFSRTKSKEVLAYLVDRKGAAITRKELAGILWGDQEYTRSVQTHLQILLTDMIHALEAAGVGDVVIRQRGSFAIDSSRVDCDYYNFTRQDPAALSAYSGEYMANYSWAEFTQGILNEKRERM